MPRTVDPKRTRKALRIVRKLKAASEADPASTEAQPQGVDYSHWENSFLNEVDQRLEKYGSAFANLSKGRAEDALSVLQTVKLREIAAKARAGKSGKQRKGLTTKKPLGWKKRQRPQD